MGIRQTTPADVVEACEQVLRGFLLDEEPSTDPALIRTPPALRYAEAVALQALDTLAEARGNTADQWFAPLAGVPMFAPLAPAMPALVRYLRGRLAGHAPVLRLDPGTPAVEYTLLVLAVQALEATGRPADALTRTLAAVEEDPVDDRAPVGDLAFGLDEGQDDEAEFAAVVRDHLRRTLTGAVPLASTTTAADGTLVVLLDDAARPELAALIRLLAAGPQPAPTMRVEWGAFAGPETSIIRLAVAWSAPVVDELALVFDLDLYEPELRRAVEDGRLALAVDEHHQEHAEPAAIRVPVDPAGLADLLDECAGRRAAY
ncbi:MAG: hypothetical protein AUG49_18890 [Catenulispora sp. 13_1_20CM_3_70_7]|nr:MAG: hypothetical protein AUG49_18890 [Catenulispora sp. 13_1_20CM_3_70_7]